MRTLLLLSVLICCCAAPAPGQLAHQTVEGTSWYNIRDLGLEGKAWNETKHLYDRLPREAEGNVQPMLWTLSRHSAGLRVRFRTNAGKISARWTLRSPGLSLVQMPGTGLSGLDLYFRTNGRWRWLGLGRPDKFPTTTQVLVANLPQGEREYLLYLPLYSPVESVEIGIPESASFGRVTPNRALTLKPLVFYGTSIMQGAAASRPGIPGYSRQKTGSSDSQSGLCSNGRMDSEVVRLLAELDPAIYVIDCLPNLVTAEVPERTQALVKVLRAAQPQTPIVLVENINYEDAILEQSKRQAIREKNDALRRTFRRMVRGGGRGLYYVRAGRLLDSDGEATVDGAHPNDLGFVRMANGLEPVLREILEHGKGIASPA